MMGKIFLEDVDDLIFLLDGNIIQRDRWEIMSFT